MRFEDTEVWGFKHALRGMRNPKNSWDKSDSVFGYNQCGNCNHNHLCDECSMHDLNNYALEAPIIGTNDMKLAQKLIMAGSEHRKFMRQIFVSADITAPLYFWKEFDQYKIGTVTNSTSTIHKLSDTPITLKCFEINDYDRNVFANPEEIDYLIQFLESLRQKFIATGDKRYWKELIRWLPSSWLYKKTVTLNYENLYVMVHQRENHKLSEWSEYFMAWVSKLPYSKELIFLDRREVND